MECLEVLHIEGLEGLRIDGPKGFRIECLKGLRIECLKVQSFWQWDFMVECRRFLRASDTEDILVI